MLVNFRLEGVSEMNNGCDFEKIELHTSFRHETEPSICGFSPILFWKQPSRQLHAQNAPTHVQKLLEVW